MNWELSGRLLELVRHWAWDTTVSGSLLILLVWLLQRVCGKALGVRGCYWLSLLVLLRLLWPAPLASRWSLLNLPRHLQSSTIENGRLAKPVPLIPAKNSAGANTETSQAPLRAPNVTIPPNRLLPHFHLSFASFLATAWLAGALALCSAAGWQHRRLSKWVRTQPEITDAKMLSMLAAARSLFRVRTRIRMVLISRGTSPALFGWRKPCFLLPQEALAGLSEDELRMVLLHEMAHIKRHDVLLNWVMILGRSVHWFNPLVWMAMRQLRADRELVCDAMVLGVLKREDHPVYGGALIKLLELFSRSSVAPTLVSVIHNKQEIKRRLSMIPKFTPTARATGALVLALLAVLWALTFTRAAEPGLRAPAPVMTPSGRTPAPAAPESASDLKRLEEHLAELDVRILSKEQEVDRLRKEFAIPIDVAEGQNKSTSDPEALRMVERERINAEAQAARSETLLEELKSRTPTQLIQALPTAVPDPELNQLLRDLNMAENKRARLSQDFGPESSQVKAEAMTVRTVKGQIEARVSGILDGLAAQAAAQRASSGVLAKHVTDIVLRDAELSERYRPYFRAKSDLAILQKVRDELMLQVVQRQFGHREGDRP